MGPYEIVEAYHKPESSPVAGLAPGQTAGAAPQGGYQPTQRAIPLFHKGRLDRCAELAQVQLLHKAAGTAKHHPPADHHPPSRGFGFRSPPFQCITDVHIPSKCIIIKRSLRATRASP
jgi:hypothetical protein